MTKKNNSLGVSFSDVFSNGNVKRRRGGEKRYPTDTQSPSFWDQVQPETVTLSESSWKMAPLKIAVVLFIAVIAVRLFHLQIIDGSSFRVRADANRLLSKTIHAPRGIIYDRNNKPLVENAPAFVKVGTDSASLISYDEALAQEAANPNDPSIEIQAVRQYPFNDVLAHVLGYTSEITADELSKPDKKAEYKLGDRIGRAGVEQSYEQYLRGKDGASLIEVDAMGKTIRELGKQDSQEGKRINVTIDSDLQKVAYTELKTEIDKLGLTNGVLIAQNPKTGEILAMVSLPSYDNNLFSKTISQEEYQNAITSKDRPLFNRAIAGVYPPGSIYKIVTATAGFLSRRMTKDTTVQDTGIIHLGPYTFPNWFFLSSGGTDGIITVAQAIARSNDIFFYKVGEWAGNDWMVKAAKDFGLGRETGIDLPGEETGLVPTSEWKEKTVKEPWYPGDTYHMAIGQGYNLVTPMQLNEITAYVANGGKAYKPHLVSQVIGLDGAVEKRFDPQLQYENILSADDLASIRQGMKMACEDASGAGGLRGTGWPFFGFGIPQYEQLPGATESAMVKRPMGVGCKTGTAEFGDPKNRTHAWFTVFAPYDNPEIAMTILIEAGGEGSNVSAPVAKNILEWYFSHK